MQLLYWVMELDINTQIIDMDVLVGEQIIKNNDDSYTILLNSRLSHERQLECYRHALLHISNADFNKDNADEIEFNTHGIKKI